MLIANILATLALLGLVGCSSASSNASIDWVNFITFNGITYLANFTQVGRVLQDSDVGPVFAKVKFKLSGNIHDPGYQARDGDAAFLDAGTPVYTVKGYAPWFRLAAHQNDRVVLFEADTNPKAKQGADLLDIGGKVQYIGINSEQDGTTELGAIKDQPQVASLVVMVLSAPVDQNLQNQAGTRYFIVFHLSDGTAVTRVYWPKTDELSRGIMLPKAFGAAVEGALQH